VFHRRGSIVTRIDDVNSVVLEGVLLRAAQVRQTSGGTLVARFTLLSVRSYEKGGRRVETVSSIDVEAWGHSAELLRDSGTRATRVRVSGSLVQDTYAASGRHGPLKVLADRVLLAHVDESIASRTKAPQGADAKNSEPEPPVVTRDDAARALRSVLATLTQRRTSHTKR
jgi:single-stranded DNA-binding protein